MNRSEINKKNAENSRRGKSIKVIIEGQVFYVGKANDFRKKKGDNPHTL